MEWCRKQDSILEGLMDTNIERLWKQYSMQDDLMERIVVLPFECDCSSSSLSLGK